MNGAKNDPSERSSKRQHGDDRAERRDEEELEVPDLTEDAFEEYGEDAGVDYDSDYDEEYEDRTPGDEDYPVDRYPEKYSPQDFPKADLEDVSTNYTEGGYEDENRSADNIVSDLDMGEAVYYERDNDYEHMDGPVEDDEELNDEDGYELEEPELEERMIRQQVEEDEEEDER
ncbi:MAG TPA: hypothetical protein VF171_08660 [Trueperaceae bacterium]